MESFPSFEINERVGLGTFLGGDSRPALGKSKNSFVQPKIKKNEKIKENREKKQKQKIQWARLIGSRFYPEKQKKQRKKVKNSIGTKARMNTG